MVKLNIKRPIPIQETQSQETLNMSKHIFDVYITGAEADSSKFEIDAFYWYSNVTRSFIIFNRESVPLEIMIKPTLPPGEQSELAFSLSKNYSKLFRALKIAPFGRVRIYVHFTAIPESGRFPRSGVSQACSSLSMSEGKVLEKNFEIRINCRLVSRLFEN